MVAPTEKQPTKNQTVYSATTDIIYSIFNPVRPNKAVLAALRKSNSILDYSAEPVKAVMFQKLDPRFLSPDGTPTYAQNAIFIALKAFAIFQQGQKTLVQGSVFKKEGLPLFTVFGKVRIQTLKSKVALDRRVDITLATQNFKTMCVEMFSVEKIVKAQKFKFKVDFGLLASDLYKMQFDQASARKIALKWGQQYFNQVYELSD